MFIDVGSRGKLTEILVLIYLLKLKYMAVWNLNYGRKNIIFKCIFKALYSLYNTA